MYNVLQFILYGALGAILGDAKVYASDWHFWVIILIVTGIRLTEFVEGLKRSEDEALD